MSGGGQPRKNLMGKSINYNKIIGKNSLIKVNAPMDMELEQ